jgi:sialate O-acetylesterase
MITFRPPYRPACALVLLLGSALAARAAETIPLRLAPIFTDHMVLQQEMPIVVWGWAAPAQEVTVALDGQSAKTRAGEDGAWKVTLPAAKADGKAHTLSVKGGGSIELKDVLLGEVWLCSGQSNMGRPVSAEQAKTADVPLVRLFNSSGETPRRAGMDDVTGWVVCTPASLMKTGDGKGTERRGFSEVAYVFGRKLHEELKVPVGLIQANCGGSTAKDWTPPPADVAAKIVLDEPILKITHQSGLLYWVRMRGLVPFAFRGVIWYQGEDDGRNPNYGEDLKKLIESWRTLWNRPDLPFYFAQIAQTGYAGGMLGVWEGQVRVMETVPNTGLAVSNDVYDGTTNGGFIERPDKETGWTLAGGGNPHPPGKDRIAKRLANIALVKVYTQPDRPLFGPMYDSHEVRGDKVLVKLKYAGSGLATRDGKEPDWFEISDGTKEGNRLKYVKAQAKIVGADTVEVSAAAVPSPKYVRFGWNTLARFNLINKENLPAVSFRTEPAAKPK